MRKWVRRVRGAIGMGLTWAVAWLGLGAVVGLVAFDLGAAGLVYNALASAAAGFLGGATFAVVLGLTEGRRRFDQLSLPRFAFWGTIGGALVGGLQLLVFSLMGSAPNALLFIPRPHWRHVRRGLHSPGARTIRSCWSPGTRSPRSG